MASNGFNCINNLTTNSFNFNGNTPLVGEIWSTWDQTSDPEGAKRECWEITDATDLGAVNPYLISEYADCYECLSNNYYLVLVTDCIGGGEYTIPLYEFGFLPIVGEKYYFEITNVGKNGGQFFSCFTIGTRKGSIVPFSKERFDENITYNRFQFINGTPSSLSYETCEPCLSGNSFTYEVTRCTLMTVL
jgi:hypothetical protein